MIISRPVQTAAWNQRGEGALLRDVVCQTSVAGTYLPPVLRNEPSMPPPQTIISRPVQTAECAARAPGAAARASQESARAARPPASSVAKLTIAIWRKTILSPRREVVFIDGFFAGAISPKAIAQSPSERNGNCVVRFSYFQHIKPRASLPTMEHEVHDEVGLEMGRRVAARLGEQPALL